MVDIFLVKSKSDEISNIVIYAYTGIGNFILYTPALILLRKNYPNAHIVLRYGNGTRCEEVTKNSELFDEYIEIKSNASWISNCIFAVRNFRKYDVIISDFHNNNYKLALEMSLLGAPIRAGHSSGSTWLNDFDFIYNKKVELNDNKHEIDLYLDLVNVVIPEGNREYFSKKTMVYLEGNSISLGDYIPITENKPIIGIQMGSSPTQAWKQWPKEHFSELISLLSLRYNILLLGSPNEKDYIENVIPHDSRDSAYNLAGEINLIQSCDVISQLDFMISNDSGLMHVANAFEVPLIAIYGPTDYNRTAPLAPTSTVMRADYPCMPCFKLSGDALVQNCPHQYRCLHYISAEDVYEMVIKKLES